ncbi:Ferrochelatase [Candidatus Magnetaquicoccaceae bacterium FCR-1]|uniref:Ferrochelatase n=1 Tax=Candidatus Magnetaquiglobus chichijimensis TaxID=3141448 RepID=A0ABQ0C8S3_9PROT
MSTPSIGVLLAQLGTPDAPETQAVRRFLKEFLSDRRVVDLPRWKWLPLLHGVILPARSPRSARLYRKIWRPDGVSPLLHHTRRVTEGLGAQLGAGIRVEFAMRYGSPAIAETLHTMTRAGIQRLLIIPLFPQYASATTASIADAVAMAFAEERLQPALRFAPPFFADDGYIRALADVARARLDPTVPRDWLFSFHGLPQRFIDEGDPYAEQCRITAQRLAEELHLPSERWHVGFQSRFGREVWLTPDTAGLFDALPRQGRRNLAVLCPGFTADCLETLEEIAEGGAEIFHRAGGERFDYVPCLNDTPAWIGALTEIARRELSGWLEKN